MPSYSWIDSHNSVGPFILTCGLAIYNHVSGAVHLKDEISLVSCLNDIACYILYLTCLSVVQYAPRALYKVFVNRSYFETINQSHFILVLLSTLMVTWYEDQVIGSRFLYLSMAHLAISLASSSERLDTAPNIKAAGDDTADSSHRQIKKAPSISYGVGMACSFVEGYLIHIFPDIHENIRIFEARNHIFFPVKRLFLIIPKKLYCPSDLKEYNIDNRTDLCHLEYCQSLQDVTKDVAGVKRRSYRNSVYLIRRPAAPPVPLVVESATPLHTLHRSLQKNIYEDLMHADTDEIVADFQSTLSRVIDTDPSCYNKCVLVCYDRSDASQNLADILLQKIAEIEPNFDSLKYENLN